MVRVSGFFGDTGSGVISLSESIPAPESPDCASATLLSDGETLIYALSDAAPSVLPACEYNLIDAPRAYFTFMVPAGELAEVSTCSEFGTLDTVLSVFRGDPGTVCGDNSLAPEYCNDDTCFVASSVLVTADPGADTWFVARVTEKVDGTGNGEITLTVGVTAGVTEYLGGEGAWEDPSNWSSGVPGSYSAAVITAPGSNVTLSSSTTLQDLVLGDVILNLNQAIVTATGNATMHTDASGDCAISMYASQLYTRKETDLTCDVDMQTWHWVTSVAPRTRCCGCAALSP